MNRLIVTIILTFTLGVASYAFYYTGHEHEGWRDYEGRTLVTEERACEIADKFTTGVVLCYTGGETEIIYEFSTDEKFEDLESKNDSHIKWLGYVASGVFGVLTVLFLLLGIAVSFGDENE